LEKQLVTVKYRTNRTDKAKLKAAIEKLGFTCEEVKKQEE
jgi:copper chaperone CopZ